MSRSHVGLHFPRESSPWGRDYGRFQSTSNMLDPQVYSQRTFVPGKQRVVNRSNLSRQVEAAMNGSNGFETLNEWTASIPKTGGRTSDWVRDACSPLCRTGLCSFSSQGACFSFVP